jgi:predicted transcriptional regulator
MVKECIDVMYFNDNWEFIKRNIQYLKEEKGKGKNNKIRFKLMDIEDVIKKME